MRALLFFITFTFFLVACDSRADPATFDAFAENYAETDAGNAYAMGLMAGIGHTLIVVYMEEIYNSADAASVPKEVNDRLAREFRAALAECVGDITPVTLARKLAYLGSQIETKNMPMPGTTAQYYYNCVKEKFASL
jgi:hypothetical protein